MPPIRVESNIWNVEEGEQIFDVDKVLVLTGPVQVRVEYFDPPYDKLVQLQTQGGVKIEAAAFQFPEA